MGRVDEPLHAPRLRNAPRGADRRVLGRSARLAAYSAPRRSRAKGAAEQQAGAGAGVPLAGEDFKKLQSNIIMTSQTLDP